MSKPSADTLTPGAAMTETELAEIAERAERADAAFGWEGCDYVEYAREAVKDVLYLLAQVRAMAAALDPFARIAGMNAEMAAGASTIVNIDRCRDASAALAAGGGTEEKQP